MGIIENVKPSEPKVAPAKKPATRGGPTTPMGAESDTTQRLHTGKVTGKDTPKSTLRKNYDFQSLLTLFSPRAKEKAEIVRIANTNFRDFRAFRG